MTAEEFLEQLKNEGVDTDNALYRMMGDTSFYLHLLKDFCREGLCEELYAALTLRDALAARQILHTLKGSLLTLGLTPLLAIAERMSEALHSDDFVAANKEYRLLLQERAKLQQLLSTLDGTPNS